MRYVYLPLDDRPCTTGFPVQLARAAGEEVAFPRDMCEKDYRAAYPFEKALAFVKEHAGNDVRLILSVDQWCYGGLLQSRSMSTADEKTALERLEELGKIKACYPGMQIHAYSVIMRASISTLSQKDIVHYNDMTLYCQLKHRAHLSGSEEDKNALAEVEARLPEELLMHYLGVRQRNHRVNAACVDMAKAGVLNTLMLLQEDAQIYGLHRLEQEKLLEQMGKEHPGIYLHNGADEGGCVALLAALCRDRNVFPSLAVEYLREDMGEFVARYEDRPFHENLNSYLQCMGIENTKQADSILLILSPDAHGQGDMTDDVQEMDTSELRRSFAQKAKKHHEAGKRVYLLDLTLANGGLPGILQSIDEEMGLENLWGYHAWNTTCNSLGSMLAQILSDMLAGKKNEGFLWERIMDDCMYESVLRQKLRRMVMERGEDPFSLADRNRAIEELNALAAQEMEKWPFFAKMPGSWKYSLPWPRVFECRAQCEVKDRSGAGKTF
ncbi:MAG: DUF4127 family protein [Clostridia bacterium]|nr:DUF4127 family protein [Clostridia bacterium]